VVEPAPPEVLALPAPPDVSPPPPVVVPADELVPAEVAPVVSLVVLVLDPLAWVEEVPAAPPLPLS
jgi:hypothetical protein